MRHIFIVEPLGSAQHPSWARIETEAAKNVQSVIPSSAQHPSWARIETKNAASLIAAPTGSAQHPSWARIETFLEPKTPEEKQVAPSIQAGRGLKHRQAR